MPTIRIPPGVVRAETRAAVPGRWHEANLVRWQTGRMTPVGGYDRLTRNPLLSIPRNIFVWQDDVGDRKMAVLCDDKLFVEKAGDFIDRTPDDFANANLSAAQGYGSGNYGQKKYGRDDEPRGPSGAFNPRVPLAFSMDNWASELVFCSSADGRVFVYDPKTDAKPAIAQNAPTFVRAVIVTEERHLMTFGSQGFPNRVAWSDQENRAGWDFTRVTGQAGFRDLEGAGTILSAHKIPGGILIFTSTSVWIGRYIGAPFYYGFTRVAEGCAPVSGHAVAVAGARAFWMGKKNFWKYEGGVVSVLPHSLGADLFEEMDEVAPRRVCAGTNGLFPEIWFFYPTKQGLAPALTENDKYVIFNFEPGAEWWSDGNLSRSCYTSSPIDDFPLAGTDQTHILRHETGWANMGASRAGEVFAEVSSLSFDEGQSNFTVHQCQVDNSGGNDAIEYEFRGHYVRGGPEYMLQTGLKAREDGYLDTHFTARDFTMRVTGAQDVQWGMGAMIFHDVKRRAGK